MAEKKATYDPKSVELSFDTQYQLVPAEHTSEAALLDAPQRRPREVQRDGRRRVVLTTQRDLEIRERNYEQGINGRMRGHMNFWMPAPDAAKDLTATIDDPALSS